MSERKITATFSINCGDDLCSYCDCGHLSLPECLVFGKKRDGHEFEYLRLPECIAAERAAGGRV